MWMRTIFTALFVYRIMKFWLFLWLRKFIELCEGHNLNCVSYESKDLKLEHLYFSHDRFIGYAPLENDNNNTICICKIFGCFYSLFLRLFQPHKFIYHILSQKKKPTTVVQREYDEDVNKAWRFHNECLPTIQFASFIASFLGMEIV